FLEAQVAELDALAVALQTDAARFARQAGMLLGDRGVLERLVEVGVHDLLAVEDHSHPAAVGANLHRIPLTRRLDRVLRRRHDAVDGPGQLRRLDTLVVLLVLVPRIVEDLDFHADAADVSLFRGANVDTAVAARLEAILQAQYEIVVIACAAQPTAAAA